MAAQAMASARTDESARRRPLRLWPGVALVAVQWLLRYVAPTFAPEALFAGVIAVPLCGLAVIVWWLFYSRARRGERWSALALTIVGLGATPLILDESVATGMQGLMYPIYAIPGLSLAFVAWAVVTEKLGDGVRCWTMAATILAACGGWALVRTGGFTGDLDHDFAWRWSPTPEERLLARGDGEPLAVPPVTTAAEGGAGWLGFRGSGRDGVVTGTRIEPDWSTSPPTLMWRRPVGPGWSSFAVHGGRLYTQEQRGEEEVVSCHDLVTGAPIWRHTDRARFWESNAGAGPRGTPTYHEGRVYTLGATGVLNALEAEDGAVVWSRNAVQETGAELPGWGFSGSPLVVDDLLVVATASALVAYELESGEPRWSGGPTSGNGYSSPQRFTIDGVEQILFAGQTGVRSLRPSDGEQLWAHAWSGEPIVQPALTADGDLLISVDMSSGVRRLGVTQDSGGWTVVERWTSIRLKPYYNDFVVHAGHAYGFDGSRIACIDLEAGQRQWKGGSYGHGQLVLLSDQDLLLVVSERGEVALVAADPGGFEELARFQAIESKTWNHPVLVGDVLLVRNAQEMAAYRLARAGE